jgi:hypothetical protein
MECAEILGSSGSVNVITRHPRLGGVTYNNKHHEQILLLSTVTKCFIGDFNFVVPYRNYISEVGE